MKSTHRTNPPSRLRWLASLAAVLTVLLTARAALAQAPEAAPITRAKQATVFLMQAYEENGVQVLSCVGSGTLISADGLILTNAHLAEATGPCRGDRIMVALSVRLDDPPVPTYIAEPVQIDEGLDAAVLQITGGLDGSLIDRTTLNLPYAPIGDSSGLLPGNGLTFAGYPDLSASSVTTTAGVITGITSERSGGKMAWFRTDSDIGGTMSGGGAFDGTGNLVGLLTSASATSGEQAGPTCLQIQDNTRDGVINDRDACVPVGSPVTSIRPIVLIQPLIEAAQSGFSLDAKPGVLTSGGSGETSIGRLFFSTGVSENGLPTEIVSSLPSGITSLYLFFDYNNMPTGTPYEISVTLNGQESQVFGLGPLAWGGGPSGVWYYGVEGKTWPDGHYEFTVLVAGRAVANADIAIGGVEDSAVISGLTFGLPDGAGGIKNSGVVLPSGQQEIDASFQYSGMPTGQDWTVTWYLDGTQVFNQTELWNEDTDGTRIVGATNSDGLPIGRYRLEIHIGTRLAATGDVTLAGNEDLQGNPSVFFNNRMASDITRDGLPGGYSGASGLVMPVGVTSIYAFVDWNLLPPQTEWTYRWYLDGRLIAANTQPWTSGTSGTDFWIRFSSTNPLPEGVYAVEVLVKNQPMFSANVSVGSGTQPLSGEQANTDEVFISGTVVDALTGEGIPGAMVFILDVLLESPQFTWDESQILTQAITDRTGHFTFTHGLTRGNYYTAYVFADGYITIVEDNFTVLRSQDSPVEITIEMTRP